MAEFEKLGSNVVSARFQESGIIGSNAAEGCSNTSSQGD